MTIQVDKKNKSRAVADTNGRRLHCLRLHNSIATEETAEKSQIFNFIFQYWKQQFFFFFTKASSLNVAPPFQNEQRRIKTKTRKMLF